MATRHGFGSTTLRRPLPVFNIGDLVLDRNNVVVMTSNTQGYNQDAQVVGITDNATLIMSVQEVLTTFRETICKLAK